MFRIWDIDRHKMLDDKHIVFNDGKFYFDYRDFENGIALLNIVVMQRTGLKDKNDVFIFEGDIVRGENKAHEKELIVQKFGTTYHLYEVVAGVEVAKRPYCRIDSRATCNDFSSSETDLEVIGNIYSDKRGLFIQKKSEELV